LHLEMIDYKTKANYWEVQFNKFKSGEDDGDRVKWFFNLSMG
jgi:hypothetical protein